MSRPWRHLALAPLLMAALGASEIDWVAVAHPEAIKFADTQLNVRWRALFDPVPEWINRQCAYVVWRSGERAPTLLAARLLYRGGPWVRREGTAGSDRRWQLTDREADSAVLREIRWLDEPILGDPVVRWLSSEADPTLARAGLATAWLRDPTAALALAERIADPRRLDHVPLSASPTGRLAALELLVACKGVGQASVRPGLEWALLQATGPERTAALILIPTGTVDGLVRAAVRRLCREHQDGALDESGREALVVACSRLGRTDDPAVMGDLATLATVAERDLAGAAASVLAASATWKADAPLDRLTHRAATDPDPVVRHALLNLLARVRPADAASAAALNSPWQDLARHRARLEAWQWREFVK